MKVNSFIDIKISMDQSSEIHYFCKKINKYSIEYVTGFNANGSFEYAYGYGWAIKYAMLNPGMNVLDAGCGVSNMPAYLQSIGMNTTAVDKPFKQWGWGGKEHEFSAKAMKELMLKHFDLAVNYEEGNLLQYGKDKYFDRVISLSTLEHLGTFDLMLKAFDNFHRILKDDGILLVTIDYCPLVAKEKAYPGMTDYLDFYGNPIAILDEMTLNDLLIAIENEFQLLGTSDLSVETALKNLEFSKRHRPQLWYNAVCLRLVKVQKTKKNASDIFNDSTGHFARSFDYKKKAIDLIFENNSGISSFADLGGGGGQWAQAAYTRYTLESYKIKSAYLVDTLATSFILEESERRNNLTFINKDFGDQDIPEQIGKVDVIYLFDVLLHQVKPNWDEILEMYAPITNHFIIFNPQFMRGNSIRLLDLGKDEYLKHIPLEDRSDILYKDLFKYMYQKHLKYKDRLWVDIREIWQWGITTEDLCVKMKSLGFYLKYCENHGKFFTDIKDFHYYAFIFSRAV